MLFFSTATALISLAILPYALHFMKVTPNVYPYAKAYATVVFAGVPFSFTFMAFSALMRASGDTKTPVKISMLTVAMNILLDPLLIFGIGPFPEWGVAGAAIATVLSNATGAS